MKFNIILLVAVLTGILSQETKGQISLVGGTTIHFHQDNPLSRLHYFGGIEGRMHLYRQYHLFLSPQYNGLRVENYRFRTVMMPLGVGIHFNPLWDERTGLIRLIDIQVGGYAGYIFRVKENEAIITEQFDYLDYGLQANLKMRLFVFYPLYVSYSYGLATLENTEGDSFKNSFLQFGAYFPLTTILRQY